MQEFAEANHLPQTITQAIDLSLVEWVTNIISYGHTDSLEHWIDVRLVLANGEVRLEVSDDGCEFNPLSHPPVDTSAPLETRPIGGLGIHMMRKLMDRVEYRREGGRNVVVMVKAKPVSNQ